MQFSFHLLGACQLSVTAHLKCIHKLVFNISFCSNMFEKYAILVYTASQCHQLYVNHSLAMPSKSGLFFLIFFPFSCIFVSNQLLFIITNKYMFMCTIYIYIYPPLLLLMHYVRSLYLKLLPSN
jgi:hypothetical protein